MRFFLLCCLRALKIGPRGETYRREEGPVVDLPAGTAAGVLPELLDDREEDGLRRQEAGSPQRPLHAGLGDVPGVEVVVVREEGGQAQALLVDLLNVPTRKDGGFRLMPARLRRKNKLGCWLADWQARG